MCGIVGFWCPGFPEEQADGVLTQMENTLRHRGPDDHGIWFDAPAGVGFGHRRLSIVDLSPLGHQPMESASGRYVICFNGEVFNFGALMEELRALGHSFRGHSDTEVMLAAFEQWGLEASVRRFVGMFAFALWDRREQTLHLVRDRLGIKPLYYGVCGQTLLFGSELKGLRAHPHFEPEVDRNALALYLRHNYIPAPYSIYRSIRKQPPGTIITLRDPADPGSAQVTRFWSARAAAEAGQRDPFRGSDAEAVECLDSLLRDAVRLRMIADVPLGAFLSGGIDSSTVVALMQAQSERPVKTFSIGFTEESYNEAPHARTVARHLGTDHTELTVTPQQALDVIPRLPEMFDEPFSDSSQIPTYLVSELTRRHVTVSLSGDGGDELFGGYTRYQRGLELWGRLSRIPAAGRPALAAALQRVPDRMLDSVSTWGGPLLRRLGQPGSFSRKKQTLAGLLQFDSPGSLYRQTVSHWKEPAQLVPGSVEPATPLTEPSAWASVPDLTHLFMILDTVTYLPDDILVKVDRASMAVALEARVPLLDHRVVEQAWRFPLDLKVRDGQTKWVLRQVLYRYVPPAMVERPKMGFGMPVAEWLRGPLRGWAEVLLDEARLRREGYLRPEPIRAAWADHLRNAGRGSDWSSYLWDILMFQAWLEHNPSTF